MKESDMLRWRRSSLETHSADSEPDLSDCELDPTTQVCGSTKSHQLHATPWRFMNMYSFGWFKQWNDCDKKITGENIIRKAFIPPTQTTF
jgi:hypothetical protein